MSSSLPSAETRWPLSVPSGALPGARAVRPVAAVQRWTWTNLLSLACGFLTPFTLYLVGEMPSGEVICLTVLSWMILIAAIRHTWPARLLRHPYLKALCLAQFVAFLAYVGSDLFRESSTRDMARGWGRMALLTIDLLAMVYLFSRDRRNVVLVTIGQCLGTIVVTVVIGPMFGDLWKFGFGAPLTFAFFLLAPLGGPWVAIGFAILASAFHFYFDFRSYGGFCLLGAGLLLLQRLPQRARVVALPMLLVGATAGVSWYMTSRAGEHRASRSNVERAAMITAAVEAIEQSPWIGHGSWFSNTDVYQNFVLIRYVEAKKADVGGFADPRHDDSGIMAFHSQILVSMAEAGIFGATFFLVFGGGLIWALWDLVMRAPWERLTPFYVLSLLNALWNLLLSPFSGAHRVYIAVACGLILVLAERSSARKALRS